MHIVIGLKINQMNDKQNQNQNQSHALRKLQVLAWNYDQLVVLFAPVVITQFRIDFSTLIWTPLHIDVSCFIRRVLLDGRGNEEQKVKRERG